MQVHLYNAIAHAISQVTRKWVRPVSADQAEASVEMADRESRGFAWPIEATFWRTRVEGVVRLLRDQLPQRWQRDHELPKTIVEAMLWNFSALSEQGAAYITFDHPHYPTGLRTIQDPPAAITMLGEREILDLPSIAVVGARKASGHAIHESFQLGFGLASMGIAVVSGGALGCDIAAHHGAMASARDPVPAIVVFAGGLADIYPRCHRQMFHNMRQRGALFVSERLWSDAPLPVDFPIRNRIISALAEEVVVMQAAVRSGAMVTARVALDQGREVAILRHPEDDVRGLGGWALEQEGAHGFAAAEIYLDQLVRRLERGDCATAIRAEVAIGIDRRG